jgi:arylsulfatase A-like enzyme
MNQMQGLSRREFLKLISMVPVGIYSHPISTLAKRLTDTTQKNVIILVFDALSQQHMSLYGYHRRTMPKLEKFAEHATIYHNHYSSGTFTVPGTASLLTGMHPWSHRAFQLGGGLHPAHVQHSIFSALSTTHSTLAFTQNKFADQILNQLSMDLDEHAEYWAFNAQRTDFYGAHFLEKNPRITFASMEDNIVQKGKGFDSSLFLGPLFRLYLRYIRMQRKTQYGTEYPRGVPDTTELYLLPDIVDGAISLLKKIQEPTVAYLHFYPPHEPYHPTAQFMNTFADGWQSPHKPFHELSETKLDENELQLEHQYYDEFIASWDQETARLYQFLRESGLTENSYIIITSDHGDLFERGELGHWTKTIFDPVIHVPLIVLEPGQISRREVHTMTSSLDLLPTIAHLTGNPIPDWSEGTLLPALGGTPDDGRGHFSMDAKYGSSFGPLVNYSMSLTREGHRLTYYCYPKDDYQIFEFYDLDKDLQEMNDLYPSQPALAREMKDELLQKVEDVNKPFRRDNS